MEEETYSVTCKHITIDGLPQAQAEKMAEGLNLREKSCSPHTVIADSELTLQRLAEQAAPFITVEMRKSGVVFKPGPDTACYLDTMYIVLTDGNLTIPVSPASPSYDGLLQFADEED